MFRVYVPHQHKLTRSRNKLLVWGELSAGRAGPAALKDIGRSQLLGRGGSMLAETHPALAEPPRPPAVCCEGKRSVDGRRRGGSGSHDEVTGAKPQRGPSEGADTLLQDTSRHDGVCGSCQRARRRRSGTPRDACAKCKLCVYFFYLLVYLRFLLRLLLKVVQI